MINCYIVELLKEAKAKAEAEEERIIGTLINCYIVGLLKRVVVKVSRKGQLKAE